MPLVIDDVVTRLNQVDWNFSGSSTFKSSIHCLHWFPGNFIPQIPAYLIQILSDPGDIVLDPFCGSGTTGIEAISLSRRAWQSDVNLAGIQVARGKLGACNPDIAAQFVEIGQSLFFVSGSSSSEGSRPELHEWFHKDTLAQLRFLWGVVVSRDNPNVRNVLEMLFTDVLFRCASTGSVATSTGGRRRHHWGWIADNVKPPKPVWHNAIDIFRERVFRAAEIIQSQNLPTCVECTLKREDARQLSYQSGSVDLVITSPPYLGMIDYTLANRLTYLWYGWPSDDDKNVEIGARYRRNQRNVVSEYLESITVASQEIARVLRAAGYCAIVIGASRKYPHVALEVLEIFSKSLSKVSDPMPRVPTRRRISDRRGSAPIEYICVFQKV